MPTELLIAPANSVPASVTPRWSGYGTFADSIRYARIIVGTCVALTEILKSRYSSLLEELDLLERGGDECLGLVLLRERMQMLRQRARVRADAHRDPGLLRGQHDLLDLVGPADVPRVDPHRGNPCLDRLERERGVEVDVRDDRDRRQPHDERKRSGVLVLRDGDADDLAARGRERGDLRGRRGDVVRLRQRHRLHDDGRTATDEHVTDADLDLAGHG